jgi:beta-N-acetylhexosaminidase
MTAHILLPQLDSGRPASISPILLEEVLRRELSFDGVILADDLGMGAIAKRHGPGEGAVKAVQAGTDIVMLSHNWSTVEPAMKAVAQAFANGMFDPARWSVANARIATLHQSLRDVDSPAPSRKIIGCAEHRALAAEAHSKLQAIS